MIGEDAPERTIVAATIRWNVPLPEALASKVRELLLSISNELLDQDEVHRVAITAHELLENVLKYSAAGSSSFDLQIVERGGEAHVRFRTQNHTTPEHGSNVRQLVDRIATASDPVAVYDELIDASRRRKGSGLGLARLRAEADMDVTCKEEKEAIAIVAERRVLIQRPAQ